MDLRFGLGAKGGQFGGGRGGLGSLLLDIDAIDEAALEAGAAQLLLAV